MGARLADAGIGVVALPATDLFLLGRTAGSMAPRGLAPLTQLDRLGVRTAVATNNVLNPFTPYGDASLLRMANMYANVAQVGREADLERAFRLIGRNPAALVGRRHGVEIGAAADLVLIDASSPADAVRRIAPILASWKAGARNHHRI